MVWSRNSFLITIPAELPGNLRSKNRIQKKLKLPWKLNATTATFRVCLQSIFSRCEIHWWTKSPPANRQPYRVTLVTHGNRRTCLRNASRIILRLTSMKLKYEIWNRPNVSSVGVKCNYGNGGTDVVCLVIFTVSHIIYMSVRFSM